VHFSNFLAQAVSEHGAAAAFFVTLSLSRCTEPLDCLTPAYFGLINVFPVTVDARRRKKRNISIVGVARIEKPENFAF